MRKTCFAIASLLLMVLHSPAVRADDPLPPPIVFVKNFLQLSETQTGALIAMIETRNAALQPLAAKVHADQEELARLLEAPAADATAVGRLLIEIHAGEKQVAAVSQNAAAAFEEILSAEQRQRLQFVRQAAQVEPVLPAFKAVGLL